MFTLTAKVKVREYVVAKLGSGSWTLNSGHVILSLGKGSDWCDKAGGVGECGVVAGAALVDVRLLAGDVSGAALRVNYVLSSIWVSISSRVLDVRAG